MSEAALFLAAPLLMCLLLVGIHCYLGLHVLARGVIFVDLAIAQVAALGMTLAYFWGFEHSSLASYLVALTGTFLAALFFALSGRFKHSISQEAIIGVIYAFSSATVILVLDKLSHGAEEMKNTLVGEILWVTWKDVLKVAVIYSVVAIVHFLLRKPLLRNSFEEKGHWIWDFLFYALFGVVITSSVQVSGVLLVFSFLVVPSLISALFFQGILSRLLFGWVLGFILCFLGIVLSYIWDLPSGALIVAVFTAVPVLGVLVLTFFGNKSRLSSWKKRMAA